MFGPQLELEHFSRNLHPFKRVLRNNIGLVLYFNGKIVVRQDVSSTLKYGG